MLAVRNNAMNLTLRIWCGLSVPTFRDGIDGKALLDTLQPAIKVSVKPAIRVCCRIWLREESSLFCLQVQNGHE